MFTGIQILRSKQKQWFKRHNNSPEREKKKVTPNINKSESTTTVTPIIANRNTMSIESISRIKKIKLENNDVINIYPNSRSCNGTIISWCLTSKPVRNNTCLGMFVFCFSNYKSLIEQLLPIQAEWRIQISMHISVISKSNNVSEFLIISKKASFKEFGEFIIFYMHTFEFFEKTIVTRTNCYYFITYVKFNVIV